ncbi:GDP-L-fucose synthase [Abditibacterium utsteinense]|uniref:GDP-L-fucose synthase n=1 Tax=Abditibacterium utsteinense TaxID=1960156 RepID=A0A2S8SNX3_9BACT|nr:GDP-L-fucose synthase [Abditibacterium utsteinense]PQV62486.1 GDP-L-fucose synthase [Abditibacterium utsteinense]
MTSPHPLPRDAKIYVAGHRGLVGGALVRRLESEGFHNFLTRGSQELDLRDQAAVFAFFEAEKPDYVLLAAAKVGGILANSTYPAQFIYENLIIAANVIEASHRSGVKKLLNLGSSCIYPKLAPQPLKEEYLLTGPLEETNRAYAVAKIAAIELCDHFRTQYGSDFISAMPTNLYGPFDNFDLKNSHVLPALLRKMHDAKISRAATVEIWGSGTPRREFLHSDDLADACLFLLENYSAPGPINVGTGEDLPIRDLALLIREIVGFDGELVFDASKPDGTPRKLMDVSKLESAGWKAKIGLHQGISQTYRWFLEHQLALPQR